MLRRLMMAESPAGGHRFWRLLMTSPGSDPDWYSLQEIELRGSIGGPDLTSSALAVASAIGNTWYETGPPDRAFDNNLIDYAFRAWVAPIITDQYVGWDFGSPVSVAEVAALPQARTELISRAPSGFKVQASSDATSWTDVASFSGVSGWTLGVWKTFSW